MGVAAASPAQFHKPYVIIKYAELFVWCRHAAPHADPVGMMINLPSTSATVTKEGKLRLTIRPALQKGFAHWFDKIKEPNRLGPLC
jgi:hypothetical protein